MTELVQATKAYYSTVEGFLTSDPLLLNLRRVSGHIKRERSMYARVLPMENGKACADTLMNGHWEEFFVKGEELLHATDDPHNNYHMLIQHIIRSSSDGEQRLESFLRPHVIKCVQGVIEVMSSLGASGCALALVDLRQRLGDKAEWIYGRRLIVDKAFKEVLSDHPDLRHAVKAQVSVLCQSFK